MKNFKIKEVKLSKKADIKIRIKLAIAQFKKNMQGFRILKIATPVFVFGFIALGIFQMLDIQTTPPNTQQPIQSNKELSLKQNSHIVSKLREIRSNSYKVRAKNRVNTRKIAYYKQYAQMRSARLRKVGKSLKKKKLIFFSNFYLRFIPYAKA